MLVLGGFVVVLSGYFGFAAHREGASLHRALLMGALSAALLLSIVSSGMVWLSGLAGAHVIETAMNAWALACVTAALGALAAALSARTEPVARW